jgi:hypothetical protein
MTHANERAWRLIQIRLSELVPTKHTNHTKKGGAVTGDMGFQGNDDQRRSALEPAFWDSLPTALKHSRPVFV